MKAQLTTDQMAALRYIARSDANVVTRWLEGPGFRVDLFELAMLGFIARQTKCGGRWMLTPEGESAMGWAK